MQRFNHDARTQSPSLPAARLELAAGRRELGPRDRDEQRNQRASFVATYHTRAHTAAAVSHRAELGCLVEKNA